MNDARGFHVQLDSCNALGRTGDLEVHVAVKIFLAGDVCQQDVLVVIVGHHSDADPGHRGLYRHAGIHQSQRRAANSRLRGRSVGFEHVGHHADGVWEVFIWDEMVKCFFRQHTMADLSSAGPADGFDLSDAEWREVIM